MQGAGNEWTLHGACAVCDAGIVSLFTACASDSVDLRSVNNSDRLKGDLEHRVNEIEALLLPARISVTNAVKTPKSMEPPSDHLASTSLNSSETSSGDGLKVMASSTRERTSA